MTITLTKEERDALYERIVVRLNGIDDIHQVVEQEDWDAAQRLGQEFSDLLRFVCSDLGWGEASQPQLTLSAPPDVLSRAATIVRDLAQADANQFESERRDLEVLESEAAYLRQTCERLLAELQDSSESED
ncbi:MAG TPA: hypothetical protein VFT79_13090 [Solirubrobacterales bacterium]|nr:hypothetical protein [Solirubrobacterales bacterium]